MPSCSMGVMESSVHSLTVPTLGLSAKPSAWKPLDATLNVGFYYFILPFGHHLEAVGDTVKAGAQPLGRE